MYRGLTGCEPLCILTSVVIGVNTSVNIVWSDADRPGGLSVRETIAITTEMVYRADLEGISPVDVDVHVTAVTPKRLYELDGDIRATLLYTCSRCLDSVSEEMTTEIHEVFSRIPLTTEQEEKDVVYAPEDVLALDPVIAQSIVLALNPKPLCRPDCLGLCPQCGGNRNASPCTCTNETVDPRLEALSQLLKQMDTDRDGS